MAYSSILGADVAPTQPKGREAERLGPSDRSDTGSDTLGTAEPHADSDHEGTGERGSATGRDPREGGDILPDHVVRLGGDEGFPEADPDGMEMTDLDEGEKEREEDERGEASS
jgi:hypothetical protein